MIRIDSLKAMHNITEGDSEPRQEMVAYRVRLKQEVGCIYSQTWPQRSNKITGKIDR